MTWKEQERLRTTVIMLFHCKYDFCEPINWKQRGGTISLIQQDLKMSDNQRKWIRRTLQKCWFTRQDKADDEDDGWGERVNKTYKGPYLITKRGVEDQLIADAIEAGFGLKHAYHEIADFFIEQGRPVIPGLSCVATRYRELDPLVTAIRKVPSQSMDVHKPWSRARFRWMKWLAICFGVLDPTTMMDPPMPEQGEDDDETPSKALDVSAEADSSRVPDPTLADATADAAAPNREEDPAVGYHYDPVTRASIEIEEDEESDAEEEYEYDDDHSMPKLQDPKGNDIEDCFDPRQQPKFSEWNVAWWDETHPKCVLGGKHQAAMGKKKQARFTCNKKGKLDPEGSYAPEVYHFVPKFDNQVRLCLGVGMRRWRIRRGHYREEGGRLPDLDYTERFVYAHEKYEKMEEDQVQKIRDIKPEKASGWFVTKRKKGKYWDTDGVRYIKDCGKKQQNDCTR